jgi:hypothetical protein
MTKDRPLLLGHHSQKVAELWESLSAERKVKFLKHHGYSKAFIYRIINGSQKYFTFRVEFLILELLRFKGIDSKNTKNTLKRPNYQFLKP